jgi:hypothetical protein
VQCSAHLGEHESVGNVIARDEGDAADEKRLGEGRILVAWLDLPLVVRIRGNDSRWVL